MNTTTRFENQWFIRRSGGIRGEAFPSPKRMLLRLFCLYAALLQGCMALNTTLQEVQYENH